MNSTKTIHCGDCRIQSLGRVSIKKHLKECGLKDGDIVNVSFTVTERK